MQHDFGYQNAPDAISEHSKFPGEACPQTPPPQIYVHMNANTIS